MPITKFICGGKSYPIKELLESAKNFTGDCELPYPLLCLVAKQAEHIHSPLSVTTILGCLRMAYFKRIIDYSANPVWMLQSSYGTILHEAVENNDLNEWEREVPVSLELDDIKITGTIDAIRTTPVGKIHLIDYKFPGQQKRLLQADRKDNAIDLSNEIKSYTDQIKSYAVLYESTYGKKVDRGTILFMPTSSKDISTARGYEVKVKSKELDIIKMKLVARAKALKEAYETNTPPEYVNSDCTEHFCPIECAKECKKWRS